MQPIKEDLANYDQMAIVEKYEGVIAYLYPIAQSVPRKHGIARDMFLECLLGQTHLFIEAGKSNQISRLYLADAGLASLRSWLRFLHAHPVRSITTHQVEVALTLLAEVGKMTGTWIGKMRRKGQSG